MTEIIPATPAQAATPGATEVKAPAATAATQPATVTITADELAQFKRDQARLAGFQQKAAFTKKNVPAGDVTPDVITQIQQEADKRVMLAEVKAGVVQILAKPEYAGLPESTKALIRKNPSALSEADTLEESLIDIENFVRENSISVSNSGTGKVTSPNPAGHETPPAPGAGGPSTVKNDDLEDVSRLTGPARSMAVFRNQQKIAKRGKAA